MMEIYELLEKLTTVNGVSGNEEDVCAFLEDILSGYGEVTRDNLNNVYCTFGEGYHFLLDAHLDEIGFVVTDITDDGFIKFDKCGGIDTRMLPANEVLIHSKEKIRGVISTKPPHLQSADDEKKAPKITDLAIDTGYKSEELREIVERGDRITLKKNFVKLLNNRISSSVLDDRSGVTSILLALDRLKKLNCKITVAFTSQEEVGTRGASVAPYGLDVDEAICVDVSFAMSNGCDKADCGELSNGVMIGFSPSLDGEMSRKLVKLAEKNGIPYQQEIMNGRTGTDADVISVNECGIKSALLSIPERYMHQPVEVVDIDDINAVSNLIVAYITERVGELNA